MDESHLSAVDLFLSQEFRVLYIPAFYLLHDTPQLHYVPCSLSDLLEYRPQTTSSLHCYLTTLLCVCCFSDSQMHRDNYCWYMLLDRSSMNQVQELWDGVVVWRTRRHRLQSVDCRSKQQRPHHRVIPLPTSRHLEKESHVSDSVHSDLLIHLARTRQRSTLLR